MMMKDGFVEWASFIIENDKNNKIELLSNLDFYDQKRELPLNMKESNIDTAYEVSDDLLTVVFIF